MGDRAEGPPGAERVFNLPDLGEGLEDAEIVEWRVSVGDHVELNQPLVEVNTAKALVEIPSPVAGVVTGTHGEPGDVVKVGTPLVTFRLPEGAGQPEAAGETAAADGITREAVLVGYGVDQGIRSSRRRRLRPPGARREAPAAGTAVSRPGSVRASPPVRRLAREHGLDLSSVYGSGPEGRITRDDVLKAVSEGKAAGAAGEATGARASGGKPPEAEAARVPGASSGAEGTADGRFET